MGRKELHVARLAAAVICAAACGACGSSSDENTASPDYAFHAISEARASQHLSILEPVSLEDALPNSTFVTDSPDGEPVEFSFSDAVITGNVVDVSPGVAIAYSEASPSSWTDDSERQYEVEFDDPRASERDVLVTVRVDKATGSLADSIDEDFTFRFGVVNDADPSQYMASLRSLGKVVVVLEKIRSGERKGEYIPTMRGALLGEVTRNGSLDFPGLDTEEAFEDFVGDLDTEESLLEAATVERQTKEFEN